MNKCYCLAASLLLFAGISSLNWDLIQDLRWIFYFLFPKRSQESRRILSSILNLVYYKINSNTHMRRKEEKFPRNLYCTESSSSYFWVLKTWIYLYENSTAGCTFSTVNAASGNCSFYSNSLQSGNMIAVF